ncbi:MAG: GNAT family N-acetyltransferase/peptidase C39 family protein [Pseudomonadota bacterium]|nr:GNAT family N-acetyltransferase/peptidase C39 family protein [Pseudomonadota bacterium]
MNCRLATLNDVPELVALEQACFAGDRLTARRFRHFIRVGHGELWLLENTKGQQHEQRIAGYALVLFHRGTSLARLYSIAVHPECQGQGIARRLLNKVEQVAIGRGVFFMRLEVRMDNLPALTMYRKAGYRDIRTLMAYYEDGSDGLRLEKHLTPDRGATTPSSQPPAFYAQTTPFTCGPAALLMAMQAAGNPQCMPPRLSPIEEINLWREATTVYLTTGHGGCSAHGLALAAAKRGFEAKVWESEASVPFLDGVRDEHKREVMQLVHQDFLRRCEVEGIAVAQQLLQPETLREALDAGWQVLLLISTYRLNRNKAPHWVWLVRMDNEFAYINDPDVDDVLDQAVIDNQCVPLAIEQLAAMCRYGQRRYASAVLIKAGEVLPSDRQAL